MKWLLVAAALGACHAHGALAAEGYPARPIRFIVPYPPGGGNDFVARVIAQPLSESVKQPVVIDNRGGAHGIIATDLTANSPPDGYTIMLCGTGHALNPIFYRKLPYDSDRDFAPVILAASAPNILLLHPSVPANSIKELIALAKASPGQLHFASVGAGGNTHLAGELFKMRAGINIVHVPYKGTGPATTAILSGEVQMTFSTMPPALPHVRAGKLKGIGVTGARRSTAFPDVPTIAEAGLPGYEATGWWGILAPAKTPQPIVRMLNARIADVLGAEHAKQQLFKSGIEAGGGSPEQFGARIASEREKWRKVIASADIRVE